MPSIERLIASITEDRRSGRLWTDKQLAQATGLHPNKAGLWWGITEERLIQLYLLCPGETAAMLAVVTAKALSRLGEKVEG